MFELHLRDAVFDVLVDDPRNGRRKREADGLFSNHTAFVPDLDQNRERNFAFSLSLSHLP